MCSYKEKVSDSGYACVKSDSTITMNPFSGETKACGSTINDASQQAKLEFLCALTNTGTDYWFIGAVTFISLSLAFFCCTCCCYSFCAMRKTKS